MLNLDLEISNPYIMNKLKSILLLSSFAAFACTISCEQPEPDPVPATKLEAPTVTVASKTDSSFTIEWESVENAGHYSVDFMGDVTDTESLEAGYSGLESGQTYEISVKAIPDDLEKFTESDWTKLSVTLDTTTVEPDPDPKPEKYFDINIDFDKDALIMYCSITPADMDMYYYRETMTQAQVNELGGGSVETAWQAALDSYYAIFGNSIWDYYITTGFDEWMVGTTYEETEYVMAAGIDTELNRITPVEYATLETGEAPQSDNTFVIEVKDITSSSAVVYVTPSNSDPFSLVLVESNDIEGYTEDELRDLLINVYTDYVYDGNLFYQEMYMTYPEGTLYPNTEHTVLVFGWNTVPNTEIFKKTFKTLPPASSDDLTFEITAEVIDAWNLHGVFVPSDPDAQYFALAVADYEFEPYKDYPPQFIIDVCDNFGLPLSSYAEMFAQTGTYDHVFDNWNDGIIPETSYYIWAVGFTAEGAGGTFGNWQIYEEILTTPAE